MGFRPGTGDQSGDLKIRSTNLRAKGGGFDGLKSMESFVAKINEEFVTTVLIDIEDLTCPAVRSGVIGERSGGSNVANSYITRLSASVNGVIYKVEMGCIETPAGGSGADAADTDIILAAASAAPDTGDDATGLSGHVKLVDLGAAWGIGKSLTYGLSANYGDLDDFYLFLYSGGTAPRNPTAYTAGKFVIKLYGYNF